MSYEQKSPEVLGISQLRRIVEIQLLSAPVYLGLLWVLMGGPNCSLSFNILVIHSCSLPYALGCYAIVAVSAIGLPMMFGRYLKRIGIRRGQLIVFVGQILAIGLSYWLADSLAVYLLPRWAITELLAAPLFTIVGVILAASD